MRADPDVVSEREWLLAAAVVGTLVELAEPGGLFGPDDLRLRAGELPGGLLVLAFPATAFEPELRRPGLRGAGPASTGCARRARVSARVIDDVALRDPIGSRHPLRIAEAVARLGGHPARPSTTSRTPCSPCSALTARSRRRTTAPIPSLRAARRILQRLDGMGKWGGYHTEFAHLARGFAGTTARSPRKWGRRCW